MKSDYKSLNTVIIYYSIQMSQTQMQTKNKSNFKKKYLLEEKWKW